MKKSLVSVVKCQSYKENLVEEAIREALRLINFDFGDIRTVLIKPNILMPSKPKECITTHPAVIGAICKILKEKGIKITVGESGMFNTKEGFELSGIQKKAEEFGAEVKILNTYPMVEIGGIKYPRIIKDTDLIINVPKMKTHSLTTFSGAVKNIFGMIPGGRKSRYHRTFPSPQKFSGFLIRNYQNIKPGLTIMDGIVGMEGEGPSAGSPRRSGLILASENGPALDKVACDIAGLKDVPTNMHAVRLGLVGEIQVFGNAKIKVPFRKPNSALNMVLNKIPEMLGINISKQRIEIDRSKCSNCQLCRKHCPAKAINAKIQIDRRKCIECYCCQEICPNRAISVRINNILLASRKIKQLVNMFS